MKDEELLQERLRTLREAHDEIVDYGGDEAKKHLGIMIHELEKVLNRDG